MRARKHSIPRNRLRKPGGSFIGKTVLAASIFGSALFGTGTMGREGRPVASKTLRCPSAKEIMENIQESCQDSHDVRRCMMKEGRKRMAETPMLLGKEKRSLRVTGGDVVFRKKHGEFFLKHDTVLKVRGVDMAGAEFEVKRIKYTDIGLLKRANISLSEKELARLKAREKTDLASIFRINFDGTLAGGTKILDALGIDDFKVMPSGKNSVRVSYSFSRYCRWNLSR
ncbi:hypothetical protein GF318_01970 [Candidatus Micrarchaeota archaeon]|nr:hypothetical protein [Candidatus Micrarchaeota archaeon]